MNDLRVFLTGGALAGPNLYDRSLQVEIQKPCPWIPFYRAPFYAAALHPLTLLPRFDVAWEILNLVSIVVSLWLLAELGAKNLLASALFFPLLINFGVSQDGGIQLLLLIGGYSLALRGRPLAGAFLALCFQKPVARLLLPVSLWRNRPGVLRSLLGALAILGLISLLVIGPANLRTAYSQYRDLIAHDQVRKHWMPNVTGFLHGIGIPDARLSVVTSLALAAGVLRLLGRGFRQDFMTCLIASILLGPHTLQYDLIAFLLPIYGIEHSHPKTFLALLVGAPLWMLHILEPPWSALNWVVCAGIGGLLIKLQRESKALPGDGCR